MAYRSTPHPATAVSPAELMFGRTIRTKMPDVEQQRPRHTGDQVRDRDCRYKAKAKVNADRRRGAKPADIRVGDFVLVKVPNKSDKLCGSFYSNPYMVTDLCGTQVFVRRGDGKVFRRNKSAVKLFRSNETDFVTPSITDVQLTPPPAVTATQRVQQDDDHVTRTRSGRVVRRPQFYGDPVEH